MTVENRQDRLITVGVAKAQKGGRHWSLPLALVFAITILLFVAIPLAGIIIWNVNANRANTFSLTNNWSVLLVSAIEGEIRDRLQPVEQSFATVNDMYQRGMVDPSDQAGLQKMLRGFAAAQPSAEAVVLYRGGRIVSGVFRDPKGRLQEIENQVIDSQGVREAINEADAAQPAQWGELVVREGAVYVNYSMPLVKDGEIDGILVFAVSLTILSEIVTDISAEFETTAFVLVESDRILNVLAHPNLKDGHPDISATSPTVALDRVGDPVISGFGLAEWMDDFAPAREDGVEVSFLEQDDSGFVLMHRRIESFGPHPWIVGAHFPVEQIGDEVGRLFLVASVSLIALLIGLVVTYLVARRMAKPVKRFADRAAMITDLELETITPLPRSRIRELDNAATAFNAMLDGLRAFAAYVPRKLVTRLIHSGVKASTRSAERELTIMFTDIAGFTSLAESLPASETAELLNHHFGIISAIVEANGGTVDKYVGDGLMAFWGAPEPMQDHAAAACRAACAMIEAIDRDNSERIRRGEQPVRMRIGIHSGRVIIGNIGGGTRINYTVVGDVVNTCNRLQELARGQDAGSTVTVLASESTMTAVQESEREPRFNFEKAGEHALRGRAATLGAFRLCPATET